MRRGRQNGFQGKHRKLLYVTSIVGVVAIASAGYGYYKYDTLQPEHHFNNLPAIATPQKQSNAASAVSLPQQSTSGNTANATASASQNTTAPSNTANASSVPAATAHGNATGTVSSDSSGQSTAGTSTATKAASSTASGKAGTFNMLLIGSDTRQGQQLGHSDAMILIHVDLNTHQYNLLSIPRDMRVNVPPYGSTKLTSVQYLDESKYGVKTGIVDTVKEISNLTGVPINYYAETDYWGLQDMANVVGGVDINLPFDVTLTHPWYSQDAGKTFAKGDHVLNGRLLTEIVHERFSVPGTDYGRQKLQETALVAIAKKLMEPQEISQVPAMMKVLPKYLIATNMTTADIMSIFLGVKGDFHPSSQIHYYQVQGQGETIYNDVLKAKDDEVILQPNQLKDATQKYLLGTSTKSP